MHVYVFVFICNVMCMSMHFVNVYICINIDMQDNRVCLCRKCVYKMISVNVFVKVREMLHFPNFWLCPLGVGTWSECQREGGRGGVSHVVGMSSSKIEITSNLKSVNVAILIQDIQDIQDVILIVERIEACTLHESLQGIVFGDNGSSLRFGLFEDCGLWTIR